MRLETIRVGGSLCTSVAALQRFCQRLSEGHHDRGTVDTVRGSVAGERAARELERMGI